MAVAADLGPKRQLEVKVIVGKLGSDNVPCSVLNTYAQIDGADPEMSLSFAIIGAGCLLERLSDSANYYMSVPIEKSELMSKKCCHGPFSAADEWWIKQIESDWVNVANEEKGRSASDLGVCDFFRTE
jgi:hypothetical protein